MKKKLALAALTALLKKTLPNAEIHSPYGATENLPVSDVTADEVLARTGALTDSGRGTCTGKILPQNRVRIIPIRDDAVASFADVPVLAENCPGEICVCGPTTTRAYFNDAPATHAAKIADPADGSLWHRMGDVGYIGSDGELWFLGRKAERVETPAGTLFTEACEPIFNTHPDVFRSALIGLGARGNETPAIVVELRAGTPKRRRAANRSRKSRMKPSSNNQGTPAMRMCPASAHGRRAARAYCANAALVFSGVRR